MILSTFDFNVQCHLISVLLSLSVEVIILLLVACWYGGGLGDLFYEVCRRSCPPTVR
jgi:hypothetical protein